ncbi:Gfo/Idh/MocA family protein [Halorubrum rubrum]|uniref:Gfo/Idh/MocA family protein n=1 Tax=Halorubrum rubrum TaxID=1126240 RepID=A0ABD5R3Q5_9EURY|nr:Gfo/Idh/MocA family oxidoreductase [Halorubrum rubrum]
MTLRAAIIGTGADPDERDRTGYAMAYRHAPGYRRLDGVELVACADIVRENAEAFAETFDVPSPHVYEEYEEMLAVAEPDVVSVCVPPAIHADIVVDCAESGIPSAVHCEKPMATTWGDCRRMVGACERAGVQLTINHQRRFGAPFTRAKSLLDDGTVGELRRVEFGEVNLYDAGTHQFDLSGYFTDRSPVEWVLAGADFSEENEWFGTRNETQGLAQWRTESGVHGLAATGEAPGTGRDFTGCYMRLSGADGVIEIGVDDGPPLRYRTDGGGWTTVDTGEDVHGPTPGRLRLGLSKLAERAPVGDGASLTPTSFVERAIEEVVDALREGRDPVISGERSLYAAELPFASWESVRRRARVDLPLEIDGNPLRTLVEGEESGSTTTGIGDRESESPTE